MTETDTFGQLMARAVGWSAVSGGGAGAVVGLFAAIGFSSGWEIIVALTIAIPYAAAVGSIFGFLVGVPTALVTALIAPWCSWWRAGGTMLATTITVSVVKWVMGGSVDVLGPVEIVGGVLTAVSAWSVLPRVIRPEPTVGSRLSE